MAAKGTERFSRDEIQRAHRFCADIFGGQEALGIQGLRALKDEFYAAIPDKQRISRGITWVLRRISDLLVEACEDSDSIWRLSQTLYANLELDDRLLGVPMFLAGEYGKSNPQEVFEFFHQAAGGETWELREFAQSAFKKVIQPNKKVVFPWLDSAVQSQNPNMRRFVSETLRPVAENRWLQGEPQTSLTVLRRLFRERHPYPRTSVGNNLSDLSRRNAALIFSVVEELVALDDLNSTWIAHRACRNLVKQDPRQVLDTLGVDEYHYKDRHYRCEDLLV